MSDEKYPGFAHSIRDTRDDARERKDEKRSEREDAKYLAWVRKQRCIIAGNPQHRCKGRMEAHHEPAIGKRTDWHDHKTVAACLLAHKMRHTIGKTRFELRYGVKFEAEIEKLQAKRGQS